MQLRALRAAVTGDVHVPTPAEAAASVPEQSVPQPPSVDRAQLEERARELGVSFQPNIGDGKLQERVDAAQVAKDAAAASGASVLPGSEPASAGGDEKAKEASQDAPGLTPTSTEN